MNVYEFVAKWRQVALTERSASQQHFLDLCEVFDHPKPALADPTGENFTFEKGAAKHGGGQGAGGGDHAVWTVPRLPGHRRALPSRWLTSTDNGHIIRAPTTVNQASPDLDAIFLGQGRTRCSTLATSKNSSSSGERQKAK
jgi:hypothetical protein